MALNSPQIHWNTWFDTHGPRLMLFARQQTRTESDAEDVLQEAFFRLCKSSRDCPPDLPLVFTTIRRAAVDHARRLERRRAREEEVARQSPPVLFDTAVEDRERAVGIERALRRLPEPQQEVLVLKIWGELTFEEIGQAVGIPPNTAASRYRYALHALKEHLQPSKL
jgi:RNA polymerase sigma-70 factor, ECF subfamily